MYSTRHKLKNTNMRSEADNGPNGKDVCVTHNTPVCFDRIKIDDLRTQKPKTFLRSTYGRLLSRGSPPSWNCWHMTTQIMYQHTIYVVHHWSERRPWTFKLTTVARQEKTNFSLWRCNNSQYKINSHYTACMYTMALVHRCALSWYSVKIWAGCHLGVFLFMRD